MRINFNPSSDKYYHQSVGWKYFPIHKIQMHLWSLGMGDNFIPGLKLM